MDELKRHNNKYAYLRQLPIAKLLELLKVVPVPASCPEDEAYVDALEEAIIEKENEISTGLFPDVDQQWEQFVTHYLPDLEDTRHESERMKYTASAQTNQQFFAPPQKRVARFTRMWRAVLVAAAAIICMLAVMVTAQAAGIDVFGAIARWTKDVFSFGQIAPDSEVSDNLALETTGQGTIASSANAEFASLQEAFDAYGMTEVHEPRWLPKGYALDCIDVLAVDDPFLRSFSASYTDGEGRVSVKVMSYEGEPITQVQKTDNPAKSITKNGTTFYLIKNTGNYTIAWYTNQYEYYLSSNEGENIMWEIADSMFE